MCSWHILNNLIIHVHSEGFVGELRNLIKRYISNSLFVLIYDAIGLLNIINFMCFIITILCNMYYSVDEFEFHWQKMLRNDNVENKEWTKVLYDIRQNWANTWLHGSYFGGFTATNICESMNAFLKRFLDEKLPLWRAL